MKLALFDKKMRVELWQFETGSGWKKSKQATPGSLEELEYLIEATDEINQTVRTSFLHFRIENASFDLDPLKSQQISTMAVHVLPSKGSCKVGIAVVDVTTRLIKVTEFLDDEHFYHLETAIVQRYKLFVCIVLSTLN